jgi:tetratricopeptide (TPR) repeat protein
MRANRPADAARAYAAMAQRAASTELVVREAMAWRAANQPAEALRVLNAWLERNPEDVEPLNVAAQIDLQAGRTADAERRLTALIQRAPDNAIALNNLAWLLAERGRPEDLARARVMGERAFFMLPGPETADTFGWALAKSGQAQQALPLLRQAVAASRGQGAQPDPSKAFRLATTLREAGQRQEALAVIEPVLASDRQFPERAAAERLLAELRRGG